MHLIYCDETNLEERSGDFLIYGGLIIDGATAKDFSAAVDVLRKQHRIPRDYRLKFNPGPEGFEHAQFIVLKQQVLELANTFGAKLMVYAILHDIATDPDTARRNGINQICYNFDCFLARDRSSGLVLIDRFNDAGNKIEAHLRDKFMVGVTGLPYSAELRLSNIVGFHYSAVGQSHFPSIVDVALGSLRFAVNAFTREEPERIDTAKALLGLLIPLFWRPSVGAPVPELGFTLSPKSIRSAKYRAKYSDLKAFLATGGVDLGQEIAEQKIDPLMFFTPVTGS